jgi:pimeloyl-ACP methyl ester carboxylesterase
MPHADREAEVLTVTARMRTLVMSIGGDEESNMSRDVVSIDADGLRVSGITVRGELSGGPLLVALHGGSYTSRYFDVPGHSLLERAAANNIAAVALDRPGYANSAALPPEEHTFDRSAGILSTAIGRLWDDYGPPHDGVVLVGHSIGAAISVHLAAKQPEWPLLGIALSGIHDVAPAQVRNAWDAMPAGQPVTFTPEQRRTFFYGPDWTIEPDIVQRAEISAAPVPLSELLEVVGRWPEEAAGLAARVTVPVHYLAFEFERLWTIDAATVRDFAAHFTASPLVASELMPGIGHDADHHRNSQAFHLRQFAFALDCVHRMARRLEHSAASAA